MQNSGLLTRLNTITIVSCIAIVLFLLGFFIYIRVMEQKNQVIAKKKRISQLPSIIQTLGVLGTFLGISIGLWYFNPDNLDQSIPLLLSGLKTAFLTSLIGMVGSLLLNRTVTKVIDAAENAEGAKDKQMSVLNAISNYITAMSSEENKEYKQVLKDSALEMRDSLSSIKETMEIIHTDLEQVKDDIEVIKGACDEIRDSTASIGCSDTGDIPKLLAVASTAAASIAKIDNDMEEVKDASASMSEKIDTLTEGVEEIKNNTQE